MYCFFVDDSSEHKKAKGVNKNVIAAVSHNEYKDVLLNNKCLRHTINRMHSKDHISSIRSFYHALMIKYTSQTMGMMN